MCNFTEDELSCACAKTNKIIASPFLLTVDVLCCDESAWPRPRSANCFERTSLKVGREKFNILSLCLNW